MVSRLVGSDAYLNHAMIYIKYDSILAIRFLIDDEVFENVIYRRWPYLW